MKSITARLDRLQDQVAQMAAQSDCPICGRPARNRSVVFSSSKEPGPHPYASSREEAAELARCGHCGRMPMTIVYLVEDF